MRGRALCARTTSFGDWSVEAAKASIRNPALTIAVATVVLFTVARVPTEIFYWELGVRPEDVGLNSIQVLLQGSAVVLVLCIVAGMIYAGLLVLVSTLYVAVIALASGSRSAAGCVFKTGLRISLLPVLISATGFALWLMIGWANEQSASVKAGQAIDASFYPWRAEQVMATWRDTSASRPLPGCDQLFYLGEANNRVALYDAERNMTYRIHSEDIELGFPLECPSGSPERDSNS